jgi:hypothetical protein
MIKLNEHADNEGTIQADIYSELKSRGIQCKSEWTPKNFDKNYAPDISVVSNGYIVLFLEVKYHLTSSKTDEYGCYYPSDKCNVSNKQIYNYLDYFDTPVYYIGRREEVDTCLTFCENYLRNIRTDVSISTNASSYFNNSFA